MAAPNPGLGHYAASLPSVRHLSEWWTRFTTNTGQSLTQMTPQNWIRLVIIVGTYLLVRPYLLKLGAHVQKKQLEKEERRVERERAAAAAAGGLSANDLRGGRRRVEVPGVESEDEEGGDADGEVVVRGVSEGGEWGRRARVRQRKVVRRAAEEHERRLYEKGTESDKEIEDLLED